VKEVTADKVVITRKDPKDKDAKPITEEISAGFVLWSTGIGTSKRRSLIGPPEMS
jgi:NADH dehydrogenase